MYNKTIKQLQEKHFPKKEKHKSHSNGFGLTAVVIDWDAGGYEIGEEKESKVNLFQPLDCVFDLRIAL